MEVMDIAALLEGVATFGLPTVLVIVMSLFIFRIYKKSEQREDALRAQIIESQKINAQAIQTITLYAERLGVIEEDIKEVKQDVNLLLHR
jgi:hypothetical protein